MSRIIAITGCIGSGKSVVCRVVEAMGYPVYDCDCQAKRIMDTDAVLKQRLRAEIDPCVVDACGNIDRPRLSQIVFNDKSKLLKLNAIVHGSVRDDIARWLIGKHTAFVETAILYQSGLDAMVDEVWDVTAPEDVRIERVKQRNGLTEQQIRARIESQRHTPPNPHPRVRTIINDNARSILLQIHKYINPRE